MSDLRERLAERLVHVAGGLPNPGGMGWGMFLLLADECIRQMEWARHDVYNMHGERDATEPLTAAPDDWTVK